MDLSSLALQLKKNGVVGAGGAGFPSYAKLDARADTVILNCAECEPLFKVHRQALAKYTREILFALNEVSQAVAASQVIVAIKGSYRSTIEVVEQIISEYKNMKIAELPEIYPVGDEVVLTYETTKRVVPPGKIPITVGVIVYNVETMLNAYNAIKFDRPVTKKLVTVAGEVKNPKTFFAPIGMEISKLVSLAGGATMEEVAYLSGGAMTGRIISPFDVVTKTTNAILVLPKNHFVINKRMTKTKINLNRAKSACCQCRMCTDLCPRNLLGYPIQPNVVMRASANADTFNTDTFLNTMYCSQCGLCEMYSCVQGLSPRSLIGVIKTGLKNNGVKMPKIATQNDVNPDRQYRTVPMERLITRLGLKQYDVSAPIDEVDIKTNKMKIMLSQHIGAPAVSVVKTGDKVTAGQMIASVGEKLGADIHSSVNGIVEEVKNGYILIERTN